MVVRNSNYPTKYYKYYKNIQLTIITDVVLGDSTSKSPSQLSITNLFDDLFLTNNQINLFDKNQTLTSGFISNNEINSPGNEHFYVTDYIKIKPDTYYSIPYNVAIIACEYSKDKQYIKTITMDDNNIISHDNYTSILSSSTTQYMRFNIYILIYYSR